MKEEGTIKREKGEERWRGRVEEQEKKEITGQYKTGQDRTYKNTAGQNITGQDMEIQNIAGQNDRTAMTCRMRFCILLAKIDLLDRFETDGDKITGSAESVHQCLVCGYGFHLTSSQAERHCLAEACFACLLRFVGGVVQD